MKKKKKEKKILYQLIFSAFLLFSNAYLVKANSDILSQDSTGKYCINTEQDYYILSKIYKIIIIKRLYYVMTLTFQMFQKQHLVLAAY